MKVAGLFSGCGGLDLGFKQAGFDIVWANDIDEDSCKTYQNYIGDHVVTGDIKELINSIPTVDIIIGGPPCQSFSLVGKRLEDDERGSLVFSFFNAIKKIKPAIFLMENVPGLASSKYNNERIPSYLARKIKSIGYDTYLSTVRATDYFVPQMRERVILIGFRNGMLKQNFTLISSEEFRKIVFGYEANELPINAFDALDDLGDVNGTLVSEGSRPAKYTKCPHSPYSKLMRSNNANSVTCVQLN